MGPLEAAKYLLEKLQKDLIDCNLSAGASEYVLYHDKINFTLSKIEDLENIITNVEDYIERSREYLADMKDRMENYLLYPDGTPYYVYLEKEPWELMTEEDQEKERKMEELVEITESPQKINKNKGVFIDEYDNTKVPPFYIKQVKKLEDIPPMFNYYGGDEVNKEGIYISPNDNFFIRVSLVDVYKYEDTTKPNSGTRCKFGTRERCTAAKKQNKYVSGNNSADSSVNSSCKFVHINEDYCRVGHIQRCAISQSLGKKQNFDYDIGRLNESDTKTMLMNAVPDVFYSFIWHNKNKLGFRVFSNLNKCE